MMTNTTIETNITAVDDGDGDAAVVGDCSTGFV